MSHRDAFSLLNDYVSQPYFVNWSTVALQSRRALLVLAGHLSFLFLTGKKHSVALDTMKAVKQIGKGLGATALAVAGALFAEYTLYHFPGWPFALSLLLSAFASMPMVHFFNLFPSFRGADPRPDELHKQNDDWNV